MLLVKAFIFTPVIVNGRSMMTTLHENDIMILDKIGMKLKAASPSASACYRKDENKI